MALPTTIIEARGLASRSFALASTGFRQILENERPRPESVNAFAKLVEAYWTIEKEFSTIANDTTITGDPVLAE